MTCLLPRRCTKLTNREKLSAFRKAWITFALIPVTQFIMHLFRAGNLRDVRDLQVTPS